MTLPSDPNSDRFGIPLDWDLLSETQEQRADRIGAVMELLREAFSVAVHHLGDSAARDVWNAFAKVKPGRPRGRRKDPRRDAILLAMYDEFSADDDEKDRKKRPRLIAALLKDRAPNWFPATVGSLETHIRRLVKDRDERAVTSKADRHAATDKKSG